MKAIIGVVVLTRIEHLLGKIAGKMYIEVH